MAAMALTAISGMPLTSKADGAISLLNNRKDWRIPPSRRRTLQNHDFILALPHVTASKAACHQHLRAAVTCAATVIDSVLTDSVAPGPAPTAAESSEVNRFDVSGACVKPSFRSGPQAAQVG